MTVDNQSITPEHIRELSASIQTKLGNSVREIEAINTQAKLLSLNARIEAARAGEVAQAFAVVAGEMGVMAKRTEKAADDLINNVQQDLEEMSQMSNQLAVYMETVRGQRLSDLALNNIDLIDRNLYERTCDVRWWATDPSLTQASEDPDNKELAQHASRRMRVILDAYTVYFDLVLCTPCGKIIANGSSGEFRSVGVQVATCEWFQAALATRSGDEFGFETAHASPLVNGQRILAYSCAVREGGKSLGNVMGVLGVLFRWDSLAQTVVQNTALPESEKSHTRVMIVDDAGLVLADTRDGALKDRLDFKGMNELFKQNKGFTLTDYEGSPAIAAHATSPGFETYSTGWHSVIIQRLR